MRERKKLIILILLVTMFIELINCVIIVKQNKKYQDKVNIIIANIVGEVSQKYPDIDDQDILKILNDDSSDEQGKSVLYKYGIDTNKIQAIKELESQKKEMLISSIIISVVFGFLVLIVILIYENKQNKKIENIITYIEEINKGNYNLKIEENTENELSNLSNELYKITVMLKEQAEKSNKDKQILQTSLEDISHQLKTPLTSISIMLDNIRENPQMDESTRQEFIYEISRQVDWINWLVISLLKLSKLESGTAIFKAEKIDVKKLIDNVIKNLAIPLDIKQQKINVSENKKDIYFIGDYNWQLEALTNIVKNCIEHTPENKNIYIEYSQNNFYTKIIVRDEGCGIEAEDLKHIFERFYKGKNSSNNSVGIGLALARSIIEKDNGYIICTSKSGQGTTFEIKYSEIIGSNMKGKNMIPKVE